MSDGPMLEYRAIEKTATAPDQYGIMREGHFECPYCFDELKDYFNGKSTLTLHKCPRRTNVFALDGFAWAGIEAWREFEFHTITRPFVADRGWKFDVKVGGVDH